MIDTRNNRAISPSLNLVKARVKQGFMEYRQREAVSNIYTLDKTKKGYWLSVSLGQIHKIISNSQSVVFHAGRCFEIICYAKITIKEMRRYKTPLNFK
nr:MAG TPA: hypothetical protein [Caudoviricetes sp.]